MHKKLLIGIALILSLILSFSVCFANDELQKAANSVRDAVGGAENAVEDAAKGVSNASKDATNSIENGGNNVGNAIKDGANNAGNEIKDSADKTGNAIKNGADKAGTAIEDTFNGSRNNNYTATRTSAENTFMGMNSTAWTWLILGIAAIAIIALVWYYSMQLTNNSHNNDE